MMSAVLQSLGTMAAVLNAQRQILAVNTALLRQMNLEDSEGLLGLRPARQVRLPAPRTVRLRRARLRPRRELLDLRGQPQVDDGR